ncbi:MAG: hypothetical protein IPL78_14625 [Chloroflexi bacterium]|nr:hypothetical protein [Chloroflexota bacterium]
MTKELPSPLVILHEFNGMHRFRLTRWISLLLFRPMSTHVSQPVLRLRRRRPSQLTSLVFWVV